MPVVPVVDPMMERFNELAAELQVLRANQERAQAGRAQAEDSDEELEHFAPHISNTPFLLASKFHTCQRTMGLLTLEAILVCLTRSCEPAI